MKIIDEIKAEWNKNRIRTGFMGIIILIALLSYFKPTSTSSIWSYLGITAIQLTVIGGLVFIFYWFYWRKKR